MDKDTLPIKTNQELCLKTATKAHVSQVQSWFRDSQQVLEWAGPSFGFPVTEAAFQEQLSKADFTSFSLLHNNELIGFGQYQLHPPFLHLGRLAINPSHRGKGLASILLAKLIENGDELATIKTVSLYVYVSNTIGYKAYLSAGFTKSNPPDNKQLMKGCDFLILRRD